ncbi:hypothetical protein ACVWZV_004562 [Bradyrhizobium sp. GM5.1]|jgi:hypothetical protein
MNSPFRFADLITKACIGTAMREHGGADRAATDCEGALGGKP